MAYRGFGVFFVFSGRDGSHEGPPRAPRTSRSNAGMARDDHGKLIDPFGGETDLRARESCAMWSPAFVEDPLRVLRVRPPASPRDSDSRFAPETLALMARALSRVRGGFPRLAPEAGVAGARARPHGSPSVADDRRAARLRGAWRGCCLKVAATLLGMRGLRARSKERGGRPHLAGRARLRRAKARCLVAGALTRSLAATILGKPPGNPGGTPAARVAKRSRAGVRLAEQVFVATQGCPPECRDAARLCRADGRPQRRGGRRPGLRQGSSTLLNATERAPGVPERIETVARGGAHVVALSGARRWPAATYAARRRLCAGRLTVG